MHTYMPTFPRNTHLYHLPSTGSYVRCSLTAAPADDVLKTRYPRRRYRDEVVQRVINVCSKDHYALITNFEWYIQVLIQLTRVEGTRHGALIASQLQDVCIRVQAIRPFAVSQNPPDMLSISMSPPACNSQVLQCDRS